MHVRHVFLFALASLASASSLQAALFSQSWNSGFTADGVIPDGNATGWFDTRVVTLAADGIITDVNLSLTITGGWNGDLYAYLAHPGMPTAVILLNRPGVTSANLLGYNDSGISIRFDDGAANGDVHFYQDVPGFAAAINSGASWQPDARAVSPLVVNGSEARTASLSLFNNMAPGTGPWTLFVADLSRGEQSTVISWGLEIASIPEPAFSSLALLAAAGLAGRRWRKPAGHACDGSRRKDQAHGSLVSRK